MYNGIINVYKEPGFTSHDVVAKLRGILKQKKIGHTGTLDPDAKGVLPVCLGKATKLCDMLTDKDKIYEAVLLLGVTTDTQDISGKILEENKVDVKKIDIANAIKSFEGEYDQIPPMYSALKVNGKKLYELAREGKVVERKSRRVEIKGIEIKKIINTRYNDIDTVEITMVVECSKGTYIRTLCQDIGEKLGCGGCMKSLIRTRVSSFDIEEAFTLSQIEELRDNEEFEKHIIKIDDMFLQYPKTVILEEYSKLLSNGNKLDIDNVKVFDNEKIKDKVRVYNIEDDFIAIYELEENNRVLKPVKMFGR